MLFFAYDEYMYTPVFKEIIPEFTCLGAAKLSGYRLFFHRAHSQDGSGRANIVKMEDPECDVYGVLYDMSVRQKYLLDQVQGLGFGVQETLVRLDTQCHLDKITAFSYVANKAHIFADLVPFEWYKQLLIRGAREHQLVNEYIHRLERAACQSDTNEVRENHYRKFLSCEY